MPHNSNTDKTDSDNYPPINYFGKFIHPFPIKKIIISKNHKTRDDQ